MPATLSAPTHGVGVPFKVVNRVHRIHGVLARSVLAAQLDTSPTIALKKRSGTQIHEMRYYQLAVDMAADYAMSGKEVFKMRTDEILRDAAALLGVEPVGLPPVPQAPAVAVSDTRIYRAWSICRKMVSDQSLGGATVEVTTPSAGTVRVPEVYRQAVVRLSAEGKDVIAMSAREVFAAVFGGRGMDTATPVRIATAKETRNIRYALPIFTLLISALQIAEYDESEGAAERRERLDKLCADYKLHTGT